MRNFNEQHNKKMLKSRNVAWIIEFKTSCAFHCLVSIIYFVYLFSFDASINTFIDLSNYFFHFFIGFHRQTSSDKWSE